MKKIFYIALLLFCTNIVFGQNKLANAVYSLKNNELDKAKELIDAAAEDSLFNNKPATWYYRGFVYKEIFKRDEISKRDSELREKSMSVSELAQATGIEQSKLSHALSSLKFCNLVNVNEEGRKRIYSLN